MEIASGGAADTDEVVAFLLHELPRADPALVRGSFDPAVASHIQVVVARDAQGVAGTGTAFEFPDLPPGMRVLKVVTRAGLRRRGIGGRLHRLLTADVAGVTQLGTQLYDDDPDSLAVAKHWGYEIVQRSYTSRCDVSDATWPTTVDGVGFEACDDLTFDDEERVESMLLASQTNPEVDLGVVNTLAGLRTSVGDGQRLVAVLARLDGVPAAISVALAEGDRMHVMYSGVDRTLRGRNLGLLTKQALHAHGRELQVVTALTDNEEHNTGIRHVNERLGYVVEFGSYWLKKDLHQAS